MRWSVGHPKWVESGDSGEGDQGKQSRDKWVPVREECRGMLQHGEGVETHVSWESSSWESGWLMLCWLMIG